jgi:hypothetical protein
MNEVPESLLAADALVPITVRNENASRPGSLAKPRVETYMELEFLEATGERSFRRIEDLSGPQP